MDFRNNYIQPKSAIRFQFLLVFVPSRLLQSHPKALRAMAKREWKQDAEKKRWQALERNNNNLLFPLFRYSDRLGLNRLGRSLYIESVHARLGEHVRFRWYGTTGRNVRSMIGNRLDDGVGYTQRCVIFWLKRWFGISDELEGEISVFEDPTHGERAICL